MPHTRTRAHCEAVPADGSHGGIDGTLRYAVAARRVPVSPRRYCAVRWERCASEIRFAFSAPKPKPKPKPKPNKQKPPAPTRDRVESSRVGTDRIGSDRVGVGCAHSRGLNPPAPSAAPAPLRRGCATACARAHARARAIARTDSHRAHRRESTACVLVHTRLRRLATARAVSPRPMLLRRAIGASAMAYALHAASSTHIPTYI